jgi:hypothetical protein
MRTKLLLTCLVAITIAGSASADRRKYAYTYQYFPPTAGESELEFYQTTRLGDVNLWEYQIEVEHGLSSRVNVGFYQIFSQRENESMHWDAFKFRSICILASPGKFLLDPSLYLEYKRHLDLSERNELETKLLLSRDFGRLNLALNPVYEIKWAPGKPKHEVGIDVGLSREFSYELSVGAESLTRLEFADSETATTSYIGPVVSFAKGSVYYTAGYYWGLTGESDNARVRLLLGIRL